MASPTKHTPGPWLREGSNIYGPPDPRSKHNNGRTLVGGVVDELHDWRGSPSGSSEERSAFAEETAANARLIAAAPDLLAACKGLVAVRIDAPDGANFVNACDVARAAIAKVEGAAIAKATGGGS